MTKKIKRKNVELSLGELSHWSTMATQHNPMITLFPLSLDSMQQCDTFGSSFVFVGQPLKN